MTRQALHDELLKRLKEKRRFLQVLAGPRQVGKTTLVRQVIQASKLPAHYASADEPSLRDRTWIEQQWDAARLKARESKAGALLVLDEVQKVSDWSTVVKLLWDTDTHVGVPLKVVLLGSAPLLIQRGLTESLAGRFEVIPVPHWSFAEMREAFGWNLEQYIFYGAYPGSAELISEPERWRRYVVDSLIETTISRDILLLNRVDKPACYANCSTWVVPIPARFFLIRKCSANSRTRAIPSRSRTTLNCSKARAWWRDFPNMPTESFANAGRVPNCRCSTRP